MKVFTLRRSIRWQHRFNYWYGIEALANSTDESHDKKKVMAFRERLESAVGCARFTDHIRCSRDGIFSDTATVRERATPGFDSQTLW